MLSTNIYKQTKTPNLFKNTYWGSHAYEKCNIEIIENRNKFVIEYQIKKQSARMSYAQDIWANYDN